MRPDIKHIFQERFRGHEADVDPGLWQSIRSELAATGTTTDPVQEHFRRELQGHEADVDPGMWDAISSQIGQGAAAATTAGGVAAGGTGIIGWAAAGLGVLAVATGVYLASPSDPAPTVQKEVTELRVAAPSGVSVVIQAEAAETKPKESLAVPQEAETEEPSPGVIARPVLVDKAPAQGRPVEAGGTAGSNNAAPDLTGTPPPEKNISGPVMDHPVQKDMEPGHIPAETPSADNAADPIDEGPVTLPETLGAGLQVVENVIKGVQEEASITTPAVDTRNVEPWEEEPLTPHPAPLPDIFLPNTFTPNNDGVNDTYTVERGEYQDMVIQVFNLDHRLVFRTEIDEPWDGGNQPGGYYVVVVRAVTADGRTREKSKMVWLNRDHY